MQIILYKSVLEKRGNLIIQIFAYPELSTNIIVVNRCYVYFLIMIYCAFDRKSSQHKNYDISHRVQEMTVRSKIMM